MEDIDDDGTRREFIVGAAAVAVAGLGVAACSSDDDGTSTSPDDDAKKSTTTAQQVQKLPEPDKAPFDHVVVVMMENRSFDALLGWLPGADGKQAGLTYARKDGEEFDTWRLAPDFQGCSMQDPFHFSAAVAEQFNDGKIDGFLTSHPENDLFPLGYYTDEDLPILAKLATSYTTFDNYFSSMLGPTWPNRFYQLCATTDVFETGDFPKEGAERPSKLELAIFDRLNDAGITSAYYSPGEPMTMLFQSKKYDALTRPYEEFLEHAKEGTLPHVSFVDPNYTAEAEFTGLSNDFHAYGDVRAGDEFLAEVHDAIANSPQWDKTVMVINFDEHGGFFDHVVPPPVEDDTVVGAPVPNLKNLGFRVPAIVVSPFAPDKIETDGPYEHCSVLKMIEWRWGLEPMTVRDEKAKNLAEALDFSKRREPATLPDVAKPEIHACVNPNHVA
jgi:phospholipase C